MPDMLKDPFKKFTAHARAALERARSEATSAHADAITPQHLLAAILAEKGCLAYNILKLNRFRAPLKKESQETQAGPAADVPFGPTAQDIIKKAAAAAAFYGHAWIGTEHLLLGIAHCSDLLKVERAHRKITHQLEHMLESSAHFSRRDAVHLRTALTHQPFSLEPSRATSGAKSDTRKFPALSYFCENLTHAAHEGKLTPVFGREQETARMMRTLLRKTKNNPLIVGEAGVGKTAIVHGFAQKLARGEVPAELLGKQLFSLDVGLLVAGTMFRGEFEARLKDVIEEAKHEDVILFIDELHVIVGAGSASGSLDFANMLKPALAGEEIKVIAATTPAEYRAAIERDAALARRFQPIMVQEQSEAHALELLMRAKEAYEKHHGVAISDDALSSAIRLTQRYQPHRRLPDKALDVIDETASRLRMRNAPEPARKLAELEQKLSSAEHEKRAAVRHGDYEKGMRLKEEERLLLLERELLRAEAHPALTAALSLDAAHVKDTIEEMLGVSTLEEGNRGVDITEALSAHIVGQGEALEKIGEVVVRAQAGLTDRRRPLASFMFLGPSGVGKTETAKALARTVFGESSGYKAEFGTFIRVDMSEFTEPHSVSRLVGAPPGYVGFEEGGHLTGRVKQNPYCLVLFDEIEKAHPQVFHLLLQMLDEGMLTSAQGEHVSFRNAIVILTSNIGTEEFNKKAIGFKGKSENRAELARAYESVKKSVLSSLKEAMRPELLNRIDHIVTFMPLDEKGLQKIVRMQFDALAARLRAEKSVKLEAAEDALALLAEKSKSDVEGARLVRRVIAAEVEFSVAKKLIQGELAAGGAARLTRKGNVLSVACTQRV